jgi:formylglycine-generating enzyme required for sulfatase activity
MTASLTALLGCDAGSASKPDLSTPERIIADEVPSAKELRAEPPAFGERAAVEHSVPAGREAGDERDDNGLRIKFVWCPPGKFTMGSPPTELGYSGEHNQDENQADVTLTRGFWLGKTEVTQAQWNGVLSTAPWSGQEYIGEGDNYPATYVSWDDAKAFCEKLSERESRVYRLPTEAEWEYACRCGQATKFSFGDDESLLDEYAWYRRSAFDAVEEHAHAVGQKRANSWGLHDMHGNVWEWCEDTFSAKLPGGIDPLVIDTDTERVRRGGSFVHISNVCRCAFRDRSPPQLHFDSGFRIALSPDP